MSRMGSHRDDCGMAMHTKCSRWFFVYTRDELFSKHAILVLLHLVLACIRAIPALIHALMAAPFGHVSTGIALILAHTHSYSLVLGQ